MKNWKESTFKYFQPIIQVLKEFGGSATGAEVVDRIVVLLNVPEEEQAKILKSGTPYIANQIAWARYYLAQAGFIDASQRGIWSLTEKAFQTELTDELIAKIFKDAKERQKKEKEQKKAQTELLPGIPPENDAHEPAYHQDYKADLLNIFRSLPPAGFERLCQRLLRESGFQQVFVTGKTGDGGIDGHGILQINPFVSFSVLFQCKRYQGAVTVSQIRDFRGAMTGRTDKGIFITTGTFTSDAKQEAHRDGAPPIELVDGNKLVEMFELLELGLIPKKTFDVDEKFFDEFR